jgi:hypothetical protein
VLVLFSLQKTTGYALTKDPLTTPITEKPAPMNAPKRDWQFLMYESMIQIKFFLPEFGSFLF